MPNRNNFLGREQQKLPVIETAYRQPDALLRLSLHEELFLQYAPTSESIDRSIRMAPASWNAG